MAGLNALRFVESAELPVLAPDQRQMMGLSGHERQMFGNLDPGRRSHDRLEFTALFGRRLGLHIP